MATKKKAPATTEPKPPNMDALFDRIRKKFTKADRLELVEKMREERELWQKKEAKKENKK